MDEKENYPRAFRDRVKNLGNVPTSLVRHLEHGAHEAVGDYLRSRAVLETPAAVLYEEWLGGRIHPL